MEEESREEQIEFFTDQLLMEMKRAVTKSGGDFEEFRSYLSYKEVIGELDTALHLAFGGVEKVTYKGCF